MAPQKSKFGNVWPKSRFTCLEATDWVKTHELVLYSIEAVSAMLAVKMIWRKNVITLNSNTKQESKKDSLLTCYNCSVSHVYFMFYTEITYSWKPVFLLIAADFEMASLAPKPRPICGNRAEYKTNPYGQPQARLTYQKYSKIKESLFHDVHKQGSIVRESPNIKDPS